MSLVFKELTEQNAIDLCSWKYESPYDIYNFMSWDDAKAKNVGLADSEKRKLQFRAVYREEEYIGFVRIIQAAGYIRIGVGLKPDICGHGVGAELMSCLISLIKSQYGNISIHLEVRSFNKRAIKCYSSAGFKITGTTFLETPSGKDEFYVMEYNESLE